MPRYLRALLILVSLFSLPACSDQLPTELGTDRSADWRASSNHHDDDSDRPLLKSSRTRSAPVAASRRIGPAGGILTVDGALLYIPAGALTKDVEITLRLPAGSGVQAELAPHGLTFAKPVTLAFSMAGTGLDAGVASRELMGAYFAGSSASGVIKALELMPLFRFGSFAALQTAHFSEYGLVLRKGFILVGG